MTTRYQCLQRLAPRITDELIVTSVGATARELHALIPRDGNLYRVHMGGSESLGLGLAMALPHRRVIAFEGDGSVLMGLSALPVIGRYRPPNLLVVVFDNQLYEGGGRLPTMTAQGTDLVALAQAAGIRAALRVEDAEGFDVALEAAFRSGETGYIVASVEPGTSAPYAAMDGTENKYRFIHYIEETEGIQVLQGPARSSAR